MQNENVWLNIDSLTKLFKIDRTGITRHINNIYKDEELEEDLTCAKIAQVKSERRISKLDADTKASKEYEKFKVKQDKNYISDFDKLTMEIKKIDDKK